MTINPISNSSSTFPSSSINADRNTFRQLADAIQTGDLSSAQQAFATLQSATSLPGNSPLGQDLAAVGSALQSGDVAGAQKALQTLQADVQKAGKGHGHHHHHHAKAGGADSSQQTDPTSITTDPATVAAGGLIATGSTINVKA